MLQKVTKLYYFPDIADFINEDDDSDDDDSDDEEDEEDEEIVNLDEEEQGNKCAADAATS